MDGVSCTQISWGGYHNYRKSKRFFAGWVCVKRKKD